MSRTAAKLPDLLQKQDGDGAPAGLNNADDLLAQLAGEEVDRLLSEADAAPSTATNLDLGDNAHTPNANHDAATPDEAEASLDELFKELNDESEIKAQANAAPAPVGATAASVSTAAPSAAPVEPAPAKVAAATTTQAPAPAKEVAPAAKSVELQPAVAPLQPSVPESAADALAAEMEEDEREHAAALRRMKGGGPAVAETPLPVPAPAPAKVPDPDPVAAAAGLELVAESAVAEKTSGIMIDMQAVEAQDAENASEPILVRVLAWMNSPLDGLSNSVRAAIGKIALVTTVNAVGVFLYVLIFRRH